MKKLLYILYFLPLFVLHSCSDDAGSFDSAGSVNDAGGNITGTGGSLARFTIMGDKLYTVNNTDLKTFDLSDKNNPRYVSRVPIGIGIETIFPYNGHLFIGSQLGMYIYDASSNPESPVKISEYEHVFSCDPVVVQDNYAYVTLRSGFGPCGRNTSELQIIDISNYSNPFLTNQVFMDGPKGLGVDGNRLFVCDANNLMFFDISSPVSPQYIRHYDIVANTFKGKKGFVSSCR